LPLALHLCAAGPVEIIAALGAGTRLRWPRAYTPRAGGYRTPSKAGWLGPAVSGLRARPPTPSARAPRSWLARVAGRSSPSTHPDRTQRAASPRNPARGDGRRAL